MNYYAKEIDCRFVVMKGEKIIETGFNFLCEAWERADELNEEAKYGM